ncbi:MAG: hypothetical protein U1F43_17870 [Myxococcota bacterium]
MRSLLAVVAIASLGAPLTALTLAGCDERIDLGASHAQSGRDRDVGGSPGAGADASDGAQAPPISAPCEGALGGCSEAACPTARITIFEAPFAAPQTVLHLSGLGSMGDQGLALDKYLWSVDAPSGSTSRFYPTAHEPQPIFAANVAGTYRFHLRVVDERGVASCAVAEASIDIIPTSELHIELLWHTPGDLDETDTGADATHASVGSDLDLHLLHPGATDGPDADDDGAVDGWFDPIFDTYWKLPRHFWGLPGADDDPSLDRDDTDGAGPENLNIALPEDDVCYTVGVHAWDDWGFGPSDATVRIYVHGTLVFEPAPVRLHVGDLWEVARVCWPLDGDPIWPVACSLDGPCVSKVIADYPVP